MSQTEAFLDSATTDLLNGRDLESKVGVTLLLTTTDETGWPHMALLSVGEVLALSASRVALALWPRSSTTVNLERTGQGLLTVVRPGQCLHLRIASRRVGDVTVTGGSLARFTCEVQSAHVDDVSYAKIATGIVFSLVDQPLVLARWREVLGSIRQP
jgi:flavin reductase (DIM6/NTAB) family NADH-FMN oxidoreductase RutF